MNMRFIAVLGFGIIGVVGCGPQAQTITTQQTPLVVASIQLAPGGCKILGAVKATGEVWIDRRGTIE